MQHTVDTGCCSCETVSFSVTAKPLLRLYCHCSYCQAFNEADYADVMIFRLSDIVPPKTKAITYQRYRRFLGVQRGKCQACASPAIEYLSLPLGLSLAIVPAKNLGQLGEQVKPAYHLYYHQRRDSYEDALPKYAGHWRSQMVLGLSLLKALFGRT